jgi:hypothetical protein
MFFLTCQITAVGPLVRVKTWSPFPDDFTTGGEPASGFDPAQENITRVGNGLEYTFCGGRQR